jgi:hypothetical protein
MKMNFMRETIAAAVIALLSLNSAHAQTENGHATRLGIALGVGVPTKGYMGDVVLAPDLRLQHDLGERTSLTLTTGYYGFIGTENDAAGAQLQADLIPLKAGAKFFFGNTFYLQPEVGIAFSTKKDYGNPFTYAPSLGYATNKWDVALRYEGFEYGSDTKYGSRSNGMVALRVAYAFKRPNK